MKENGMRAEGGFVTDMSVISLKVWEHKHYNQVHPKQTTENKIFTKQLNTFI
jgi:hypothetical protein